MKLNYKTSQSSISPSLVDTTSSKKVVYLRQNIREIENEDGTIFYEYEEAKLTKAEYQEYLKDLEVNDTVEAVETLKNEVDFLKTSNETLVAENEGLMMASEELAMTMDVLLTEVIPNLLNE